MFFSHPLRYICNHQPPVYEVKHAVMNEHPNRRKRRRKRRGKPSSEERERRRQQKARDLAAAAAAINAADQLQKEKTARVTEQNAAHRQVQISRSKAQKEFLAAKAARAKNFFRSCADLAASKTSRCIAEGIGKTGEQCHCTHHLLSHRPTAGDSWKDREADCRAGDPSSHLASNFPTNMQHAPKEPSNSS